MPLTATPEDLALELNTLTGDRRIALAGPSGPSVDGGVEVTDIQTTGDLNDGVAFGAIAASELPQGQFISAALVIGPRKLGVANGDCPAPNCMETPICTLCRKVVSKFTRLTSIPSIRSP